MTLLLPLIARLGQLACALRLSADLEAEERTREYSLLLRVLWGGAVR